MPVPKIQPQDVREGLELPVTKSILEIVNMDVDTTMTAIVNAAMLSGLSTVKEALEVMNTIFNLGIAIGVRYGRLTYNDKE